MTPTNGDSMPDDDIKVRIARLEEKVKAAEAATRLASESLEAWKLSANEWRQALNDQRSAFVTRPEVIAVMLVGLTILGLILKYTK